MTAPTSTPSPSTPSPSTPPPSTTATSTTRWPPAPAVAGGVALLLGLLPLLFARLFYAGDFSYVDVGHLCALDVEIRRGGLGLDGVYGTVGNGVPLWAHPSSQLLYPLRWLSLLLLELGSPQWTAHVETVLHLAGGAAAAAWLGRTYRLSRLAAVCAALSWTLSGTVLDLIVRSETTVGALWVPLGWAALREGLGRRPKLLALFGLSVAGALLGGDPLTAAVLTGVLVVELVSRWLGKPGAPRPPVATAIGAKLALFAGVAVGLAQWWPTLVETSLGRRGAGLPVDEVLHWAFLPRLWPGLVAPGVFDPDAGPSLLAALGRSDVRWWNEQPYLGWLVVTGAAAAAFTALRRRRAAELGLAATGGLWLLGAVGDTTPVARLVVEWVPLAGALRYPMKLLPAASLALVLLFAIEAARWSRAPQRALVPLAGAAVGGIVLVVGLATFAASRGDAGSPGWALSALRGLLPVAAAVLLVAFARQRGVRMLRWMPAVVVLDLLLALPQHVAVGESIDDATSPLVSLRRVEERPVLCPSETLAHIALTPEPGLSPGDAAWNSMVLRRLWGMRELMACDGLADGLTYTTPLASRVAFDLDRRGLQARDLDAARALGCTHFLDPAPPTRGQAGVDEVIDDPALRDQGEPRAWRVKDAFPPAFLVVDGAWREERDLVDGLLQAERAAAQAAFLDDPGHRAGTAPPPDSRAARLERVTGVGSSELQLDVTGSGGAVVGVRQTFALGWSAEQAGEARPVIRVAGHLLGVVVDDVARGPVVLRYRAPRGGAALAAGGLGLLGLAALALRLGRRRRGEQPAASP